MNRLQSKLEGDLYKIKHCILAQKQLRLIPREMKIVMHAECKLY